MYGVFRRDDGFFRASRVHPRWRAHRSMGQNLPHF
jgi:hypothetical protein